MNNMLIIIPESLQEEQRTLLCRHMQTLAPSCYADMKVFLYRTGALVELKQVLAEKAYEVIVIAFPTLSNEYLQIRAVRSLGIASALIVYRPDLCFVPATANIAETPLTDIDRWQGMARSLQLNMCRTADMIIVGSENERRVLAAEITDAAIITLEQAASEKIDVRRKPARKVSFVILTFNQLVDTRECVESLLKYTHGDFELIFVDNGSVDDTRAYLNDLRAKHTNVKVIFNDQNLGFSKANNQGIRIATGDYILLLNNDVIVTDGWLERHIACLESDPSIGIVGPGTNHAVGQQVVDMPVENDAQSIQKFASMQTLRNAGKWFSTHRIIGFCMLMRREVIDAVGMLDERFGPGGFEDYDFCLRVGQAGYRIMVAGDIFIYHKGGQGYHRNNLNYDKLRNQNIKILIDKWCQRALEIMEIMPNGM